MNLNNYLMIGSIIMALGVSLACSDQGEEVTGNDNDPLSWNNDIWPVLGNSCAVCHSGSSANGDFDISDFDGWINEDSNMDNPYVVAGSADSSEIIWRLEESNDMPLMPPTGQLSSENINLVKRWIDEGANP